MSYWPEDEPEKKQGPFDEVFRDAKEGGLSWPLRDRYGIVELKGPTKILGEEWYELKRRSPAGAKLLLKQAERLMAAGGRDRGNGALAGRLGRPRRRQRLSTGGPAA